MVTPVGYPLHLRRDSKVLMFSSNVSFEEFVLKSLIKPPFDKSFCKAWWETRIEIRELKSLLWFVMCLYVKDRLLLKSLTLVHVRVQECNLCF